MMFVKYYVLELREKNIKVIIKTLEKLGWDSFDINMVIFGYLTGWTSEFNQKDDKK